MSRPTVKKFTGKITYSLSTDPDNKKTVTVTVDYTLADGKITGEITLKGGAVSSFQIPTRNTTLPQDWKLMSASCQHIEALLKTSQHKPIGSVSVDLKAAAS